MRETHWWLRFAVGAELLPASRLDDLIQEADELRRILAKSILTARSNLSTST